MGYQKVNVKKTVTGFTGIQYGRITSGPNAGQYGWQDDNGNWHLTKEQERLNARNAAHKERKRAEREQFNANFMQGAAAAMQEDAQRGEDTSSAVATVGLLALLFMIFKKDENGRPLILKAKPAAVKTLKILGIAFAVCFAALTAFGLAIMVVGSNPAGDGKPARVSQLPLLSAPVYVSQGAIDGEVAMSEGQVSDLAVTFGDSTDWGFPTIKGTVNNPTEDDWTDVNVTIALHTTTGDYTTVKTIKSVPAGVSVDFETSGKGDLGGMAEVSSTTCELVDITYTSLSHQQPA